MGCNCNQSAPCNPCGQQPCAEPQDCSCPTVLKSDCVIFSGNDLSCSGIVAGQTLTETVEQLDEFICEKVNDITNALTLKNIGTGSEVYKGVDLLGRKEIRKINAVGTLATVTQNTNDISVSINETNLNTFIEANQKTYSADNVGTGAEIFKDITVVGDNTQFNFRTVVKEDLGSGESFLRDIQQNTNELNVRVKTLVSSNLAITSTDDEVRIETPMTASIPALYVNDLYIPTYNDWLVENSLQNGGTPIVGFVFRGKGTLAQPFTNSTVYPLAGGSPTITPNTAIQNALDGDSAYAIPYSYVGKTSLGYTRLNPQRSGQTIIVQNNNGFYIHAGDYNYNNIRINFQTSVLNTTSGYVIDMDNPLYFDATNGKFEITIDEGYFFECSDSLGFRNSGNTSSSIPALDTGRTGFLLGKGFVRFNYSGVDILTRYIFNGDGNINDGSLHFDVKCEVLADQQGVYFSKNKTNIDFYSPITSGVLNGSGNIAIKAFHMTGGRIRLYDNAQIYLANHTTGRTYGITFEPTGDGIGNTTFQLNSAKVAGTSEYCFVKLNNEHVDFLAFNSPSGGDFSTTNVGTSTVNDNLFENLGVRKWNVNFKNNVFSYTGIDLSKVDLTGGNRYSAINFIGNEVLETLVVFTSKAEARIAGHPSNSAFTKIKWTTGGDFVVGKEYKIYSLGTTNFVAIGASSNTVGQFFIATGVGTGTGVASLETREILT